LNIQDLIQMRQKRPDSVNISSMEMFRVG